MGDPSGFVSRAEGCSLSSSHRSDPHWHLPFPHLQPVHDDVQVRLLHQSGEAGEAVGHVRHDRRDEYPPADYESRSETSRGLTLGTCPTHPATRSGTSLAMAAEWGPPYDAPKRMNVLI